MSDETTSSTSTTNGDLDRRVTEGIEGVRLRPAMYIGGIDALGLQHLVWEVIDTAFDEYQLGSATSIQVRLHSDGSVTCTDDGGGISIDPFTADDSRPWLEVVATETFAGGRFQRTRYGEGIYFGVGFVASNALSEWMIISTHRNGHLWEIRFERGCVTQSLTDRGPSSSRGTTVTFRPDRSIFGTLSVDYAALRQRLHVKACVNPGVTCSICDDATGRHETFYSQHGVADLVCAKTQSRGRFPDVIRMQGSSGLTAIECALQYVVGERHECDAYVNGESLAHGGTLVTGFRRGVGRAIRNLVGSSESASPEKLGIGDCLKGIVAVVSVRLDRPTFEGPTRSRISNPELVALTSRVVNDSLTAYFREHLSTAAEIAQMVTGHCKPL